MKTKISKFNFLFEENNKTYIFNSLSNSLFEISKELFEQISIDLRKNSCDISQYEENQDLKKYCILTTQEDEEKEMNKIRLNSYLERFNATQMSLTIAPTSYCNFNCIYCYEKYRPKVYMNKETADKLIEFVSDQKQLKDLNVMWYGGEPLLNFKMIKELTQKFKDMDLNYSAGMITNGYLLNQNVADKLDGLNIRFVQITLDGLREVHDARRFNVRTNNSFDKIISNIDYLLSVNTNLYVSIRVNIDKTNEGSFPDLVRFIKERYDKYPNLGVSPSYVQDTGTINSCHFDRINKAVFKLKYCDLNVFDYFPDKKSSICMARHINSYLINSDGGIYKCYNDIGIKERQIAHLHEKNIKTDLLTSYLVEADYLNDANCAQCKLMPVCNGGCPYDRINSKTGLQGNCLMMKDFEKEFLITHIKLKTKWQQK